MPVLGNREPGGGPIIVPRGSGLPGNSWYPASRSRPRTPCHRCSKSSSASRTMPMTSPGSLAALSRTGILRRRAGTPPGSSSPGRTKVTSEIPLLAQMCISTCLTSTPSTRSLRLGESAHLYPVSSYNAQFLFGEHGSKQFIVVFAISKTQQCPFFGRLRRGLLEGLMVSQLWVVAKTWTSRLRASRNIMRQTYG